MTAFPDIVKSVYNSRMAIESHSYTNANLLKLTDEKLDYEITGAINYTNRVLDGFNGDIAADPALKQSAQFFRLPYGAGLRELRIRQRISGKNLANVLWNVDSLDWQDKNPDSIVERITKQMRTQRKGVILFHDVHSQSAAAFTQLAKKLKASPAEISATPIRLISIPAIADEMNNVKN
jgi:peptidoglycan/xylan/chitin deacetylase (PgdA/CDA1 family)